jgi:hypothetical protein
MQTRLHLVKGGVASRLFHQLVVASILYEPPAFDRDDPVGVAHSGKSMGDDQNSPSGRDLPHIPLDDIFALVIEGAGCFVKNQDSGIRNERPGNRDPLALSS